MDDERKAGRMGRPPRVSGEKSTKDRILEAATDLFAAQGYDATPVRQIAASLGLTESALYRHYPGKEAILGALFADAEVRIFTPLPIERDEGDYAGGSVFRGLLLPLPGIMLAEPAILKIMRIMYAEMPHNADIRRYYRRVYVEKADDHIEALFRRQIEKGAIRPCDPRSLARVFNAFRSDWAVQNFIVADGSALGVEKLTQDLMGPIAFFEQFLLPAGE